MSYILLGNSCNYKTNCITDNTKYLIPDNVVAKVSRKKPSNLDTEIEDIENTGKDIIGNTVKNVKNKVNLTVRRIKENRE